MPRCHPARFPGRGELTTHKVRPQCDKINGGVKLWQY